MKSMLNKKFFVFGVMCIVLLIVAAVMIACAKSDSGDNDTPIEKPKQYELVWQIGDNEYSDSVELEILQPSDPDYVAYVVGPKAFLRSTDLEFYQEVIRSSEELTDTGRQNVGIQEGWKIFALDMNNPEFDDHITFEYGGRQKPVNKLQLRVFREPIKAESISLSLYNFESPGEPSTSNELQVGKNEQVVPWYTPQNASYKQTYCEIVRIETVDGGTILGDDMAKYAYITNESDGFFSVLFVTKDAKAGDKIWVIGTSIHDNVVSDEFVVAIV
jgi:hypothetical protein